MTYATYELSVDHGEPVLLFDYSAGVAHWRYTSADRPITVSGHVYTPLAISAGNIVQGQEIRQKTLKVTLPRDADIVTQLQTYPPSTDLALTVFAIHYTDPDAQAIVAWIGRVKSQMQKLSVVEQACEPAYTGIQTSGLRRRWQINCPHVLYAVGTCNLAAALQKVVATLSAVSGFTVSSSAFVLPGSLSFAGGYLEWPSGRGYMERRTIDSVYLPTHTLTLAYGSLDLVAGLEVNAYPGCRHNSDDCTAFGNILNYGGDLYIPLKNPMDGNPVY
jgi:hypothetical protein